MLTLKSGSGETSAQAQHAKAPPACFAWPFPVERTGLRHVLRPYGVLDPPLVSALDRDLLTRGATILVVPTPTTADALGLEYTVEPPRTVYWEAGQPRWMPRVFSTPSYRAVLPHLTFTGRDFQPVWTNAAGGAVAAWWRGAPHRTLVVGLDIEGEIIRYRQGNPDASIDVRTALWGFDYERPNYLFDGQIDPRTPSTPWADRLGYFLAEKWAEISGQPLLAPLPFGAKGLVLLTGDDDQAYLEKYADQLATIGDLPITYFLHPQTKHTYETIQVLGPQVEIGLHPDALEQPEDYDRLCLEQVSWIERHCRRKIRLVRNHGFLNRGYLGHLPVWEKSGLELDVNYPGVDGTALTGSFLPMRVRRPDGTWSAHYSLLTAFGDGMIYALKLTESEAVRRVRRLANAIESTQPGALVFNFHPQNISDTRRLHREAVRLSQRPGWRAMGLERYLDWVQAMDGLHLEQEDGRVCLRASKPLEGLVLRTITPTGWKTTLLSVTESSTRQFIPI